MNNKQRIISLDKIGMCTSAICMLHCLSIPILFILGFDSMLRIVDQEWMELMIVVFALLIGIVSFTRGFLKHRQHFIPVLFIAGFLLLINSESVEPVWLSIGLSVAGASLITYAHFQNLRWRRYAAD